MTEISITRLIYEYFDDIIDTEIRQNIIMYMEKYNIGNKGISRITKHKFKLKIKPNNSLSILRSQKGFGCKTYYYINDIEPLTNYKVNKATTEKSNNFNFLNSPSSLTSLKLKTVLSQQTVFASKTNHKMIFISIDNLDECACLTFGKKESNNTVLRIDGIKSFDRHMTYPIIDFREKCISCDDDKIKFNSADILMKIILKLIKSNPEFSHIDKIELADSSQKQCYNVGLQLIYLRTITHGVPYCAKFGFRPALQTDYEDVFIYNRNNFKLNKTITNDELFNIINKKS